MQCAIHLCSGGYKPQGGDHQFCYWGLQPHQSGEYHQYRDVEFVGFTNLARQIRYASFTARGTMRSQSLDADNRQSTLVFCVNLSHVRELTQTFRDAGIDARYVHSKTPATERKLLVEGFKAGEYPVLVNCGSLSLPPRYKRESDILKLSSDLNRGRRHPKYRLRYCCSTDAVAECHGSDGLFLVFTSPWSGP